MQAGRLLRGPPFSFTPRLVAASFLSVRPAKHGIIALGAIGGSLALQAKRAAPSAPHPPLGALADRAQVEIPPLDRPARP